VLVGVQVSGVTDAEQRSSLKELKRLCETLGFEVVGEVTQKRKGLGAATLLGEGKLVELAAWTGGTGVVPKGPPGKKKAPDEEDAQDEIEPGDLGAPPAPLASFQVQSKGLTASGSIAGSATLVPQTLRGNPGSLVTVQVRLQGVTSPIAGASFAVNYPANVLRFRTAQDHRAGTLVPPNAVPIWNVAGIVGLRE
jgi:GTP-binding protein HflX